MQTDQTPALPKGWRLADHPKYGRVVVTNPSPDSDGRVYFVHHHATDTLGYDWSACNPEELTYIDYPEDHG